MPRQEIRERAIPTSVWDAATRQRVELFWREHRFRVVETSEYTIEGRRGNYWHNLYTGDMRDVVSDLAICFDEHRKLLYCSLIIDTIFQIVTEWDEEFWKMELDIFQTYLLYEDKQDEAWRSFLCAKKKAFMKWCLYGGGRKIGPRELTWRPDDRRH